MLVPSPARAGPADGGTHVFQFLSDVDGLLETVNDKPSLERAKPKLVARTHQYIAWARYQPKTKKAWDKATFVMSAKRHLKALKHAYLVPGARAFYDKEVGQAIQKALKQ